MITTQEMIERGAGIGEDGHPLDSPEDGAVLRLLQEREFNPHLEPPPLRPIYTLASIPISTPANLTTITSAIKTGKSAVIGAMAAAAMPHSKDADLLGFSSSNPKDLGLLWFDSEQSPDDFWHCIYRALRRAGLKEPPPWLHAYCLTGLGCKRAWECVTEATKTAAEQHGGLHSTLIDGFADLVADVNDPEESNAFVAELHDMAIKHDCPIIGVIHFNPGSEKSRGTWARRSNGKPRPTWLWKRMQMKLPSSIRSRTVAPVSPRALGHASNSVVKQECMSVLKAAVRLRMTRNVTDCSDWPRTCSRIIPPCGIATSFLPSKKACR